MSELSQVCFASAALFFVQIYFIKEPAMRAATLVWIVGLIVKGIANV